MDRWKARLEHSRAVRNGIAICNDIPLSSLNDPPGGLIELLPEQKTRFDGETFFWYLEDKGHDNANFADCRCGKDNP